MTPQKETVLQERCTSFRRIQKQNRLYTVCQVIFDILLFSALGMFMVLSAEHSALIVMVLIAIKLSLLFILKGSKANIIGAMISLAYIPLMSAFKLLDFETGGLAFMIITAHLLRILPCGANSKIQGLYGAPGFNGFILANELKTNETLCRTVFDRYNEASDDFYVSLMLKQDSLPKAFGIIKPVGAVFLAAGMCMMISAHNTKMQFESASDIDIDVKNTNRYISASTEKIYWQTGQGSIDAYLCRVGDKAVKVNTFDTETKHRFQLLCNACGASPESANALLAGNDIDADGSEIAFKAKIIKFDKKKDKSINSAFTDKVNDNAEIIEDVYLDIMDRDLISMEQSRGLALTVIGALALGVFYAMYFVKGSRHEIL